MYCKMSKYLILSSGQNLKKKKRKKLKKKKKKNNKEPITRGPIHLITLNYTWLYFVIHGKLQIESACRPIQFVIFYE